MRVVFRQKGFDAIKRDSDGFKRLPGGDYSEVDFRGEGRYIFGDGSIIGDFKDLGDENTIGDRVIIGSRNTIGNRNTIGSWIEIGEGNVIGDRNTIGEWAKIGNGNLMGEWNTIGEWADIGNHFIYCPNTTFEGGAVKNGRYIKVGQIGCASQEAYFFIDENGKFFVRNDCWFNDMEQFIERVKREHGGSRLEKQYLAACEYARAVLPGMLEEAR
ncbi:MAG: hypothetical protein KH334_04160 [Clostridiales bacterium]|nr:hypothetical protein [Clostridiales bacterium]